MGDTTTQTAWRMYSAAEVQAAEERYATSDGEWLFLYEHPVAGCLGGVPESALDALREEFAAWLRQELFESLRAQLSRREKLEESARLLFDILRRSPPPHDWLRLPADSRPQRNRSTVAYHSLLVSGFACAMVRAWLEAGKPISELLRFQLPHGQPEQPLDAEELIHFTRVGALCHDFGKHPPQRHNQRGREQVQALFHELMDEVTVFCLSEIAYRHHTGRFYRLRDESPLGPLEELIAHADSLASAADRPISDADPVASVARFLREELGDERALSLISADTDRVKGYVFETAKLPEVRGASAMLTELNEREVAALLWERFRLPPECLLYAAGGSALIVAPTQLAPCIADRIQRLYLCRTGAATISVVHRPTSPQEWVQGVEASGGNFGNLVKWLGYDLRRAKESRAFYPVFDAPPYSKRCDSCEVRPAERSEPEPDGREVFLCRVCRDKRKFGRQEKTAYLRRFEEEFLHQRSAERPAQDLNEIGSRAQGKARGYVGIIYTDGNDIGSRLEQSQTPAEFRTLSEELRRVTREATFKALAQWALPKEEEPFYPFEIVAIGGDDVFLIVPGDVALDIALDLCANFQSKFNGKLTMSAGVLIMREHLPIYYAHSIVEALLKSAKKAGRKARQDGEPIPAHIDFQVITGDSSLSEDVEAYRQQVYSLPSVFTGNHRLVQRPYRLEDLRQLLCTARWVREKDFPASQLYQLRQAVVEHVPAWARNWYRYQLARDETERENGWRRFHRSLFGTEWSQDTDAPWRRCAGEWVTPVIDLVEIFDYVRRT
ncbi:MAG: HD domain-containing protein [Abditibacteriales bacterium]|nr:HD domain-containing protein [Abditibacteriales bacterium]MDW8365283.1 HD domain-containing protein [Abditibacteriales bacterium]